MSRQIKVTRSQIFSDLIEMLNHQIINIKIPGKEVILPKKEEKTTQKELSDKVEEYFSPESLKIQDMDEVLAKFLVYGIVISQLDKIKSEKIERTELPFYTDLLACLRRLARTEEMIKQNPQEMSDALAFETGLKIFLKNLKLKVVEKIKSCYTPDNLEPKIALIQLFSAFFDESLLRSPGLPEIIDDKEINLERYITYFSSQVTRIQIHVLSREFFRNNSMLSIKPSEEFSDLNDLFPENFFYSEQKEINLKDFIKKNSKLDLQETSPYLNNFLEKRAQTVFSEQISRLYQAVSPQPKDDPATYKPCKDSLLQVISAIQILQQNFGKLKVACDFKEEKDKEKDAETATTSTSDKAKISSQDQFFEKLSSWIDSSSEIPESALEFLNSPFLTQNTTSDILFNALCQGYQKKMTGPPPRPPSHRRQATEQVVTPKTSAEVITTFAPATLINESTTSSIASNHSSTTETNTSSLSSPSLISVSAVSTPSFPPRPPAFPRHSVGGTPASQPSSYPLTPKSSIASTSAANSSSGTSATVSGEPSSSIPASPSALAINVAPSTPILGSSTNVSSGSFSGIKHRSSISLPVITPKPLPTIGTASATGTVITATSSPLKNKYTLYLGHEFDKDKDKISESYAVIYCPSSRVAYIKDDDEITMIKEMKSELPPLEIASSGLTKYPSTSKEKAAAANQLIKEAITKSKHTLYLARGFNKEKDKIPESRAVIYIPSSHVAYIKDYDKITMIKEMKSELPPLAIAPSGLTKYMPSTVKETAAAKKLVEEAIIKRDEQNTAIDLSSINETALTALKDQAQQRAIEEEKRQTKIQKKQEDKQALQIVSQAKQRVLAKSMSFFTAGCSFVFVPSASSSFTLDAIKGLEFSTPAAYILYGNRLYFMNDVNSSTSVPIECKLLPGKSEQDFEAELKEVNNDTLPQKPVTVSPSLQDVINSFTGHTYRPGLAKPRGSVIGAAQPFIPS